MVKSTSINLKIFTVTAPQHKEGQHIKPPAKPPVKVNEIQVLSNKLDTFESQQKNLNTELKKDLNETKTELAALKNQIAELKNQKCAVENELTRKFESQHRGLAESIELEQILVKYGNNPDGMSTLHYAIKQGDVNAVNLLIANGADTNSLKHTNFNLNQFHFLVAI